MGEKIVHRMSCRTKKAADDFFRLSWIRKKTQRKEQNEEEQQIGGVFFSHFGHCSSEKYKTFKRTSTMTRRKRRKIDKLDVIMAVSRAQKKNTRI